MALVINTNIASLNAQRNLIRNTNALDLSVQRLASGLRINSAKDDAAGLSISEKLSAHIRSINVAVRNAQDGISLAQTADGGLLEIGNILVRMRELSQQAASGTLGTEERGALNDEFTALKAEIDRISTVTEFNGTKLLDGTLSGSSATSGISLQIGFRNTGDDRIAVNNVNNMNTTNLGITGEISGSSGTAAQGMITTLDAAIQTVARARGGLGAIQNRLDSTISNLWVAAENLTAAKSRIVDADFAQETANFTKNQILVQAATAVLAQANVLPQQALQLLR